MLDLGPKPRHKSPEVVRAILHVPDAGKPGYVYGRTLWIGVPDRMVVVNITGNLVLQTVIALAGFALWIWIFRRVYAMRFVRRSRFVLDLDLETAPGAFFELAQLQYFQEFHFLEALQ